MNKVMLAVFIMVIPSLLSAGQEPTAEELEAWFNDDSEIKVQEVNEGELNFISPVDENALYSENTLHISEQSINDGWVGLQQCYYNLDAVPEVQVVYRYKSIRDIKVVSSKGIDKAWVEGQSVQLEGVSRQASVCTEAQIRVFYQNEDKTFSLVNGPYERRFLDGFYPLRVSLDIHYPDMALRFLDATPFHDKGIKIQHSDNRMFIDAFFEGHLFTEIRFRQRTKEGGKTAK